MLPGRSSAHLLELPYLIGHDTVDASGTNTRRHLDPNQQHLFAPPSYSIINDSFSLAANQQIFRPGPQLHSFAMAEDKDDSQELVTKPFKFVTGTQAHNSLHEEMP
jgi:hypothetical protein